MKKYRNIISFVISLLLMFSLIFSAVLVFFKGTLINDTFYREIISSNDTTNKINEDIYKDINYLLLANNIPQSVAKDVITTSEVNDYMDKSISNVTDFFLGKIEEIPALNTDSYIAKLNSSINNYILENKVGLTKGTAAVFEELKSSSKEVISSKLELLDYNTLSKSQAGQKLQKVAIALNDSNVFFGVLLSDVLLSVILLVLWKNRVYRGFAWIGYSFVSSGLLIAILSFSGLISKFYENAAVPYQYLKENITCIIEGYLKNLSIIGISMFVIGLIFMSVYWRHLYKRNKKSSN